ncbi:hypothetical protein OHB54_20885 [Streptomyces sp. NBC_01007]|nr:hypothetical protein OHB54_20885 [Streptomyces sp. NBC_01007]
MSNRPADRQILDPIDWVSDHRDEIVTVCKWVVTIAGIIVMIVGGPLGWLVFAAALIVLADTVRKVKQDPET